MEDLNKLWSCVGSAGTVDTADVGKIVFRSSVAQLGPGLPTVVSHSTEPAAAAVSTTIRAVLRYGVTPVDGLSNPDGQRYVLVLCYRDGPGQVLARFIAVDILTGNEAAPLISFDSEADPGRNNRHENVFQMQQKSGPTAELDFSKNAYYVEITLTAAQISSRPIPNPPAVSVVQLIQVFAG